MYGQRSALIDTIFMGLLAVGFVALLLHLLSGRWPFAKQLASGFLWLTLLVVSTSIFLFGVKMLVDDLERVADGEMLATSWRHSPFSARRLQSEHQPFQFWFYALLYLLKDVVLVIGGPWLLWVAVQASKRDAVKSKRGPAKRPSRTP